MKKIYINIFVSLLVITAITCYVLLNLTKLSVFFNNSEISPTSEVVAVKAQNDELVQENNELKDDKTTLQEEYNALLIQQTTLRTQYATVQAQLQVAQTQNNANQQTIEELQAELNAVRIQLTSALAELEAYQQASIVTCTFVVDNEVYATYLTFAGRKVEVTTPIKQGASFLYWKVNNQSINIAEYIVEANTTFVAEFTSNYTSTPIVTIIKLNGSTEIHRFGSNSCNLYNSLGYDYIDANGNLYYNNTVNTFEHDITLYETADYLTAGTWVNDYAVGSDRHPNEIQNFNNKFDWLIFDVDMQGNITCTYHLIASDEVFTQSSQLVVVGNKSTAILGINNILVTFEHQQNSDNLATITVNGQSTTFGSQRNQVGHMILIRP